MTTVSKGAMRQNKLKVEKLSRAVPTLDLRRKQLNREIHFWEEEVLKLSKRYEELESEIKKNPHPEVERVVEIERVERDMLNIAGVLLEDVSGVDFKKVEYSFLSTPPSFDIFVKLRRNYLETKERLDVKRRSLDILLDELTVTTQRINLFEKRLIPEYANEIRYIKGRLEDNERTTVIVAKIAQAQMLAEHGGMESA